ncbi:MAG: hypothetical protein KME15_03610 [Drouetiella hepatica Uher 2000/2452]|jgi:hypothetical protein|uniref:Uncharacterized protein n=1 Tax=Drouetiella hepatica Uher 2000/2452 TaxID=904376 RepID=A0A951Q9J5_9CYAN|nr:hypothetical protein [Drouetiella hepatica Uher 2000/2452]
MVLNSTNGHKPRLSASSPEILSASLTSWKRQSVQQFFTAFNWDDHPAEMQEIKLIAAQQGVHPPMSLALKVKDFFSAFNWDDSAIAATPKPPQVIPGSDNADDAFTLDDFSGLF